MAILHSFRKGLCRFALTAASVLCLSTWAGKAHAQYNTDRLLTSGEIALHYEDYVLSIQYFSQIIALKPYLYLPWQLRGIAKFNLEDFAGAEADASAAIRLNPYVDNLFDLRAIARIRQNKMKEALSDYNQAIKLNPSQRNYWFNRAICHMQLKDFKEAHADVDTVVQRWSKFANAYSLNAEIYLNEKDTVKAATWLDKSLELDPYDGDAWATRAYISLARHQWTDADKFLTKAIYYKPKGVDLYVNRALCRYSINNLRGAMSDYDTALDLDPDNFLAHYNRGQLRMQLGDDNRAIEDFNFIIKLEPQNFMAIFNRALLYDRTGNLRAAIRDYSTVIDQFPNFWTGLQYRARAYQRLGMTAKAEMDEFRIFKAQMNKHLGIQPRWSRNKIRAIRKRSEIDPEKYNQLVVADNTEVEHDYKSAYRGKVQNRNVDSEMQPMYALSFNSYSNGISAYEAFDREVENFNLKQKPLYPVYVNCGTHLTDTLEARNIFNQIDVLTQHINQSNSSATLLPLLLQRAVAYSMAQNFDAAISDLSAYLQTDSTSALAYWQRAYCQTRLSDFKTATGVDEKLKTGLVKDDLQKAISHNDKNAYLHYDMGNLYAMQRSYTEAIEEYTRAISLDSRLAEAYYNRGLCKIYKGNKTEGVTDLSKAGELGLYDAYSVIKRTNTAQDTKRRAK